MADFTKRTPGLAQPPGENQSPTLTAEERTRLRTGLLPKQSEPLRMAPKAAVGEAPPLTVRDVLPGFVRAQNVPVDQHLGGAAGNPGPRMSQADVDAQRAAMPRQPDLSARVNSVQPTAPQPSPLAARTEQALSQPSPTPGDTATPFFTNRADVAAANGLEEVKGVVGNQTIFGNRQLTGNGGFVQASPKSDVNDYPELGDSAIGAYARFLLQNQDRVRKFNAANDTAKETAQSDREDSRQAAINKRSDERLAFDRQKELSNEIEKRFTSVDPDSGKSVVDYTAAAELKDYIGRTGEADVGKAILGLHKEQALRVAKEYGDKAGLEKAITDEQDPTRKVRLRQLYLTAYGA